MKTLDRKENGFVMENFAFDHVVADIMLMSQPLVVPHAFQPNGVSIIYWQFDRLSTRLTMRMRAAAA